MEKLTVGIIFGGPCEEHPVSVKSAVEVAAHLDLDKYDPVYIGITLTGAWQLLPSPDAPWADGRPAIVSPDASNPGLLVLTPHHNYPGDDVLRQGAYSMVKLDVVLPVLHGQYGEDGAIQGLLKLSGIPYVGCDIPSSALCMDKSLTYLVAQSVGIHTPTFRTMMVGENINASGLGYPVFVKPARSGSSFGVSKVDSPGQLADAINLAMEYDTKLLIEDAVIGSEIGCAVLGNDGDLFDGGDLFVGEPDHIKLSGGFFRPHQEQAPEIAPENWTAIVPADIPAFVRTRVQDVARIVYTALGCRGLARVDMFLTEDEEIILNEVNTMPGLTSYSRFPRMMTAAGVPMTEVIDRLISLALAGK